MPTVDIEICGEDYSLPEENLTQISHDEPYVGTPLIHIYSGSTIHIEGSIQEIEDIQLANILEVFDIVFTYTEIAGYSNGDFCPSGKVGSVQLLVNGVPSEDLSNKIFVDNDKYEIIFS